jgi:methyltransferase
MLAVRELDLIILAAVAAERVVELAVSQRNQRRLLTEGGHEIGAGHYPLIVALHGAWLASMALIVVLLPAQLNILPLALFLALQPLRLWVLTTLGRYWTTRIITVPDAPLVTHGPYRFIRHPNYAIVVLEIALLPLAFGAWPVAVIFSVLNAALLTLRIRVEGAALRDRQGVCANTRRATS